jgi:hypothetical protein
MNNSTEIRPNFKDGILRTFVSSKETTQIMKRIHTIITDFAAILGLKNTEKTPQLIAVENFCQNMTITDYYCDEK